ncbi:zinc finger protein 423-like isoform X1 [Branchiostoma floridae]|uniref:Zinc finger protein 423-like isoform X1 n=2 Tax=Branchiostoma floridae TaxID=7739 RepID=A0A9J7L8Y0_BRAFL|nr:zinc finger protein 423-like isoform X1 [Branchiostoma floridae]
MSRRKQARPRALKRELENALASGAEGAEEVKEDEGECVNNNNNNGPSNQVQEGSGEQEEEGPSNSMAEKGKEVQENSPRQPSERGSPGCLEEDTRQIYRCDTCGATLATLSDFMDHRNYVCGSADVETMVLRNPWGQAPMEVAEDSLDGVEYLDEELEGVPNGPYPCQFCEKTFSRLTYLKRHEQIHSDKMPFRCEYCLRLFKHKRSRDRHVKLHTGDKKYRCTYCDASFSRSDHLKIHLKTHNSDKPYRCVICNKGYTSAATLAAHAQTHHKVSDAKDEFRCFQCAETFDSASDLQGHVVTHDQGSRPNKKMMMQCNYCAELFGSVEALVQHVEDSHAKDKRNKCPLCSECFVNSEKLHEHMEAHGEDGSIHRCPYCPKQTFPSIAVLEIHLRTMHGDKPVYGHLCQYCNKEYPTLINLANHIKCDHQKEALGTDFSDTRYPCDYCTMDFGSASLLYTHVKFVHSLSKSSLKEDNVVYCPQCTMGFPTMTSFNEHAEEVHGASSLSPIPSSTNSVLSSLLNEGSINLPLEEGLRYPCPYCPEGMNLFSNFDLLRDHVQEQHGTRTQCSPVGSTPPAHTVTNSKDESKKPSPGEAGRKKKTQHSEEKNSIERNGFFCSQCDVSYLTLEAFQTHLKTHLDMLLQKHPCPKCGVEFTSEDQMLQHMLEHFMAVATEYGCQTCEKTFAKADDLQKHLFDIHAHHLYRCSLCKEMFDSKVSIQVHFAIKHSNECRLYKCTKCWGMFPSEGELVAHIKTTHLHSKPFRCIFCQEAFSSDLELQCHVTTHNKQYQCHLCEASFHVQFLLEKHVLEKHSCPMEDGKKGARSEEESESQSSPSTSTKNDSEEATERVSLDEDKLVYKCDVCDGTFTSERKLKNHRWSIHKLKPHHKGNKDLLFRFHCGVCSAAFQSEYGLKKHLNENHQNNTASKVLLEGMKDSLSTGTPPQGSMCFICMQIVMTEEEFVHHCKEHNPDIANESGGFRCVICLQFVPNMAELNHHAAVHLLAAGLGSPTSMAVYICSTCKREFTSRAHLVSTLKSGSPPTYMCTECLKEAIEDNSDESLITDVSPNSPRTVVHCSKCELKFETERELEVHFTSSHPPDKSYQCIKCQKTFATEVEIQIHVTTHMMEEGTVHECSLCRGVYDSPAKLQAHLIEHTFPDKNYQCLICGGRFATAQDIQSHAIDHGPDARKYHCPHCTLTFFFEAELQNHLLSHSEVTPGNFQCLECGQMFNNNVNLSNHLKIHASKDKTLKCSLCPEVFNSTGEMQHHHFSMHSESDLGTAKKSFKCNQCDKVFPCMSNLQGHMRIHTQGKKFPCPECSKVFALARNLTIHMRSHSGEKPYQCPLCEKRFARKENRKVHLKSHSGVKPFMCPHCGKMFSRKCHVKDHMRTHALPTMHQCPACSEAFTMEKNLKRHMKKVHKLEVSEEEDQD